MIMVTWQACWIQGIPVVGCSGWKIGRAEGEGAMTERVILSWSGGKDCALALRELALGGRFRTEALLTTFVAQTDGW
jgi:hypothetical protein